MGVEFKYNNFLKLKICTYAYAGSTNVYFNKINPES